MIPYGRQDISEEDIAAVTEVLRSDYLTQGPAVPRFEQRIADYCGAHFAVSVNSATSALHLACLALDMGPGDILWTTPITFVASANCALYCGASVDFVDIDQDTFNISVSALREKLQRAETNGTLPKALVAVHLCGLSCDMLAIAELAERYAFSVIEDASHAIGGRYRDDPIGSCKYSDITVFSFHPVKIITTGEGGVAITNSSDLAGKLDLLRSHGITRDPSQMTQEPHGEWYYQQIALGFNYRMTDIQAALGHSQLSRADDFVARRQALAQRYGQLLEGSPVRIQHQPTDCYSAYHLYVIRLNLEAIRCNHKEVFSNMRAAGIGVNLHYIPVYQHPYYQQLGANYKPLPSAESYYREAISLPLFPGLTDSEQDYVVDALTRSMA